MKTTFFAFLILGSIVSIAADKITFRKFTSLEEAFKLSKAENKPVFFDTYASWCGWCTYMENNIFNLPGVADYFNEHFIAFKVDADNSNSDDFSLKYEVSGLPCMLIVDEEGDVLSRSDGAITDEDDFIDFGKMAFYRLNPETSPWYLNKQKFDAGDRSPEFLKDFAFSLVQGEIETDSINKVVELFWINTPDKSLNDETNFLMYYAFTNSFDDEKTKLFLEQKESLISTHGEEVYYDKCFNLVKHNLYLAIENDDKALYTRVIEFANQNFDNQEYYDKKELIDALEEVWRER